jgi:hypothetical protein
VTSLPTRLAERSVPIALYDLGYNLGVARRLCPDADVSAGAQLYARATAQWNADQVRVLRAAAQVAARGDRAAIRALIDEERPRVRAHDQALLDECDAALAAVERAVSRAERRAVRSHARGRLLSSVSLALGLAACNNSTSGGRPDGAPGDLAYASGADLAYGADLATSYDLNGVTCPGGRVVQAEVQACLACGGPADLDITFDAQGLAVAFTSGDGGALTAMVTDCLKNFFAGYCYPTLSGQTVPVSAHCWIA